MKNTYQQQHAACTKKIRAALPKTVDDDALTFVTQFYDKVLLADLEKIDPDKAVGLALSAWKFMQDRPSREAKIRVFTPHKKTDGYENKHTVVELLNDDRPFLIDSLSAELSRHGFVIHETIHPIFKVVRNKKGALESIAPAGSGSSQSHTESLIHFEISPLPETMTAEQLIGDLEWVLAHIQVAVEDWQAIVAKAEERIKRLDKVKGHFDDATIEEMRDFLRWLMDRNFVFLGYGEYEFFDTKGKEALSVVPDSRLGILKITDDIAPRGDDALPAEIRHFLLVPHVIDITKSSRRSPVHRGVPMDTITLKRFDTKGNVIGEARFVGLFTSNVYYQSTEGMPLVRRKITAALASAGFKPDSHDGKALKTIYEFLPRDELFQMSEEELFGIGMGILALEAKPGVRLFARKDALERFVSVMVFVPREQFSTEIRRQIQRIVERAFNGSTFAFSTQIAEAPLARLHLIIKTTPGDIPEVTLPDIEREIAKRAYLWSDLLFETLLEKQGEEAAEKFGRLYANAFPQNYINRYDTWSAVHDIGKMEGALAAGMLTLEVFHQKKDADQYFHLKIYNPNEQIALSDFLPMLENAGFRVIEEHPFLVTTQGGARQVWIRDFKLQLRESLPASFETLKPLLEETLLGVWRGAIENDRFNTLVLKAGLSWRQVMMLRAYAKYLKQIGFNHSQPTIEQAFEQHPQVATNLAALFDARFAPGEKNREPKMQKLREAVEAQLASVTNATQDRIIRRYVELIGACSRTNYFQTLENGDYKPVLSFKLDSSKVPELPLPKPYAEIFVYAPRVEGIHLRGGKVARGGLRWSDRHDDFRTEVLGLMKAQMVKNSVIVPVGSKGGFVVKKPPTVGGREAHMEEGITCYKMYLSGLLDITDNIIAGKVTPPLSVVRHDDDDPYLVVAADKGTATFSDIANGVSAAYEFWLGDAFASGGSVGYDHKKMAITARGGWISVARHFREMGVDIAAQDFTCVGIGDMSGDVFGNGMLLSKHIHLVAAFNHQHIFIDPSPDAKKGFEERKRLFGLARSTWKDYGESLISKGGGVYERLAKFIDVSKEAQASLGLGKSRYAPDDLISAILKAPVDLLWNGGIGTYVKAEDETHEQVGDRTNNAVRVNGKELRCKVVGEGGNLGFTQKGRVEYARAGGRINTDAIDNSAGVDCSDHEVNIKIAFSGELAKGQLKLEKRDKLLASMTEEVAALVLKDNTLQTQALTIAEQQGTILLDAHVRMLHHFERDGLLNRSIEFLPTDKQLLELKAARKGLTRSELAVLLAYSKMALYKTLLDSSLPDDPYFAADLSRYFPKAMQEEFAGAIAGHPLKREIIATVATNSIVNRAGITFLFDIAEDLRVSAPDVAIAYSLVRDAFGLRALWNDIESLEQSGKISVTTYAQMHVRITECLERGVKWLLRNYPLPLDSAGLTREIFTAVANFTKHKSALYSDITREAADHVQRQLAEQSVPLPLAEHIASLDMLASAFDVWVVAKKTGTSFASAGKLYFELGSRLKLIDLRRGASQATAASHWDKLALQGMMTDLYDEQRRLTTAVIHDSGSLEAWAKAHQDSIQRLMQCVESLGVMDALDVSKLMVALTYVRAIGGQDEPEAGSAGKLVPKMSGAGKDHR